MKAFKVSKTTATLAALVLLLGLVLGVLVVQQAVAGDAGTGSGEPMVIAARRDTTQAVVPSLIGKDKAQTEKALAEAGLELGTVQFTTSARGKPGTVVQQKPRAKSTVAKGSAVNVVVLLRAAATVSPKIVQRGEKVFMEFPDTVKDVTISDQKGNKLQQFNTGRRFEITESAVVTKAGRITVKWKSPPPAKLYLPWPPLGGTAGDIDHTANFDSSHYVNEDIFRQVSHLEQVVEQTQADESALALMTPDTTTIENGEPANNDISGAVQISASGFYSGTVGGDDPQDYVKIIMGPHQAGTLVSASVYSGSVKLSHSYPLELVEDVDALWFAAAPGETYRIVIEPTTAGETPYTIAISIKPVYDVHEPNNDFQSATPITLGNPINGCFCEAFELGGAQSSLINEEDWYKIHLPTPQKIRIHISSVGLGSGKATLRLYSPDNALFKSATGTNNEAELVVDFPSMFNQSEWQSQGYHNCCWRIKVDSTANLFPWGEGVPPDNYKPYQLVVTAIP
jgi:hypothetical protein